jgi:hypothetical protein
MEQSEISVSAAVRSFGAKRMECWLAAAIRALTVKLPPGEYICTTKLSRQDHRFANRR